MMDYFNSKEFESDLEIAQEADLDASDMDTFLAECQDEWNRWNQDTPNEYEGMTPEEATEEFFTRYVG